MTNRTPTGLLFLALAASAAGCGGEAQPWTMPLAPSPAGQTSAASTLEMSHTMALPAPLPPNDLVVFSDPDGFSTTDVRDARGRIVQFTNGGDLIWTADGTRLHGYTLDAQSVAYWGPGTYFISGQICADFCVFSIRFGTDNGQRAAYLTVDYGHSNPGTIVEADVNDGVLTVTQTERRPPGTPTLFGVVTEMTPSGASPVADAWIFRAVPAGWQYAVTDQNGAYRLEGLIPGSAAVSVSKQGYQSVSETMELKSDQRFDVQLVRR